MDDLTLVRCVRLVQVPKAMGVLRSVVTVKWANLVAIGQVIGRGTGRMREC